MNTLEVSQHEPRHINSDLLGHTLNITTVSVPYITSKLNLELLYSLQLVLNFTYNLKSANDWGTYNESTGKWNGIVEQILNGEADYGLATTAVLPIRQSVVDFTVTARLRYVVAFRRSEFRQNELALLRPFSDSLWLTIFGCFTLFSIAIAVLQRTFSLPFSEIILSNVLLPVAIICGKSTVDLSSYNSKSKLLIYTYAISAVVINAAFSGILIAFLFLSNGSDESLSQLKTFKSFTFAVHKFRAFLIDQLLKGAPPTDFSREYKRREITKVTTLKDSTVKSHLLESTWVVLADDWEVFTMLNNDFTSEEHCTVVNAYVPIGNQLLGTILPKKSPYKRSIDHVILQIKESGLLACWTKREVPKRPRCTRTANYEPVPVASVTVALCVLACGFFGSLVIGILEKVISGDGQNYGSTRNCKPVQVP